ncbi:acetyl/propionyl/methylcrotonyl-CoA carboxylase subunit alpha [Jeotgalibacillus sp. R-1-5s-1]|uniref:acetyl-CoA carboxylase biotin carboxylase subunit n=1 Tax=Jeotgalibacillus sp. R-1-5s-1 TaxID=2555897 RepID=UPI00106BABD2|nr:biotin carboxylase N-terminal domain-containing protein [Jeotgalibacillus sp. R-1-5s-1]TFE03587.1 ATP-grasp domain-containing protein [Jeotgalibacillus sp. R-1-5s-1]
MKTILIANRGEIALRVIRTCQKLNIRTVAIYSEADAELPYVKAADSAHLIGPPPVSQSYLNIAKIIEIAKSEKVDAIHPGYGLLSENSSFVKAVEDAGIAFIGPDADIIRRMGDKIEARKTMIEAGVPVVPGQESEAADIEAAKMFAKQAGYPVMLKASSGGGGVGMVMCEDEQALTQHFDSTKKRSEAYFGSGELFIEKYIANARHIEVQIFGDKDGTVYHLFERNCSMQRRNQKVVEESPSPALSEEARERLISIAVKAAQAVGYKNAGTIELIVDEQEQAYFLEMNTRLQVEHPATEMITGVDLVEWQIKTAFGEPLPINGQADIKSSGHAIEYRIYAEDPKTFYPAPGLINSLVLPEGEGIRVDYGYEAGNKVTPFYDPMVAKLIIHADDRQACIKKSLQAFESFTIEGLKSNIPLFKQILHFEDFAEGHYHTQSLTMMNKGEIKS